MMDVLAKMSQIQALEKRDAYIQVHAIGNLSLDSALPTLIVQMMTFFHLPIL